MRQQAKPFIIERKPSRKPKSDAAKPSIWGGHDAAISQGLQDQQDGDQRIVDHTVAIDGADRA